MPDVGRSDSQRSDSSQRPRVSFNRDVHVKRIGHAGGPRVVGALAGDGDGHLVPLAVRRERPTKLSRRQLADEARRVLQQADSVTCTSRGSPLGYSTLPPLRSRKNPRRSLSFREKKVNLSRSASDASNKLSTSSLERRKKPNKTNNDASNNLSINSLERRKKPNKSHSDYSDKSPARPRRNILKKSHSDSETAPVIELQHKKQLSPIIEASPREDYFEPMLHSSQAPANKPPLSKGRTVDAMVKRLSQDKTPRRPPRGVSPSALVSPGDGRQHNSNMPFSYTEPTQQVIYAEVVVSGGGPKQTVHTSVPQSHSDDDEGLGLTMESTRGRADGMDSRRKELITEGYFQPRVGDGFDSYKTDDYFGKEKSHIEDSFNSYKTEYHSESRVIKDIGDGFDNYKKEYRSEARVFKDDQRSPLGEYRSIKEPPIQPRIITNDLSSRRDRLESRIESQRKDRFTNSRKFEASYNNRREFLHSQLNSEDSIGKKEVFADSGIEVDSPKERPTAKIIISTPKVARSDLPSDGDETDGGRFSYSKAQLSSTRLVQEQRRATETVPTSTVLIRHYTDEPHTDEDYEGPPPPKEEPEQPRRKEKPIKQEEKKKAPKKKQVSAMDKVKQLFSRNNTNKKEKKKKKEPEEDPVAARYTEYKGSAIESDQETLTPLSQQHSPLPHRRHDHTPSPSPHLRYRRERTPSPPPSSRYHTDRSASPPPSSRYHRDRTPSPPRHRRERSPSPPSSRHRREVSPLPPRHQREDSPPSSRHYKDRVPSPRYRRERSPSPPPSRHRRDHSPPSRYQSREPSPHTLRRHQHSPSPSPRQQLLQVPLNDHPSSRHHRWMSSDTEERKKAEAVRTRERLATPTPSPSPRRATSSATLTRINNSKNKEKDSSSGGWFKSLDRLTRKNKPKVSEKAPENEKVSHKQANENGKNLRFFGDTDQESVTSIPPPMPLQTHRRYKSNSNMSSSNKVQAPRSNPQLKNRRHHRSAGDVATSSAESTTEGDSSQQSQRSVVYLHAATVGDIPTPAKRAVARRTQSREELSSVTSSHLQPQTRTISRSISVLAPWKPRHPREALEVHYDKEDNNKNYVKNGRPPKVPVSQQTSLNSSTMNRINRRKNAENNKQRVSRAASTESLKGREKLHPSTSIESLSHKKSSSKVSRSASMPKDNRVTAGWFKLRNKKQGT